MLNKKINLIIYLPGYGGNFITNILSLNDLAYFYSKNSITSNNKKEILSFKDIQIKYGHWINHHNQYKDSYDINDFIKFFKDKKTKFANMRMHPFEFYSYFEENIKKIKKYNSKAILNYCQVNLSLELEHVIDKFKITNGGFPILRNGELQLSTKFKNEYNPFIINFDNFILGEKTFIAEYERICNYLDIPIQLEDALLLYKDWYIERKFGEYLK
jgi:hypothetical protein